MVAPLALVVGIWAPAIRITGAVLVPAAVFACAVEAPPFLHLPLLLLYAIHEQRLDFINSPTVSLETIAVHKEKQAPWVAIAENVDIDQNRFPVVANSTFRSAHQPTYRARNIIRWHVGWDFLIWTVEPSNK